MSLPSAKVFKCSMTEYSPVELKVRKRIVWRMVSGVASENDFETEQLPELVKAKWPNVTLEVTKLPDDNYYTSLKTKLASGECPDIILAQPMYTRHPGNAKKFLEYLNEEF